MNAQIGHLMVRLPLGLLLQLAREVLGEAVVDHELGLLVVYLQAGQVGDYGGSQVLEGGLSWQLGTSLWKM